jgi:hypothetical protein
MAGIRVQAAGVLLAAVVLTTACDGSSDPAASQSGSGAWARRRCALVRGMRVLAAYDTTVEAIRRSKLLNPGGEPLYESSPGPLVGRDGRQRAALCFVAGSFSRPSPRGDRGVFAVTRDDLVHMLVLGTHRSLRPEPPTPREEQRASAEPGPRAQASPRSSLTPWRWPAV